MVENRCHPDMADLEQNLHDTPLRASAGDTFFHALGIADLNVALCSQQRMNSVDGRVMKDAAQNSVGIVSPPQIH